MQQVMEHGFEMALPEDYQPQSVLAYHGRDQAGPAERWQDRHLRKGVLLQGAAVELALCFEPGRLQARVCGAASHPWPVLLPQVQQAVRRMAGLNGQREAWMQLARQQPDAARLLAGKPALWLPLTAEPFEALCWAIIGQQINLSFATALRRSLIQLAGVPITGSDLLAHPGPGEVAALSAEQLTAQRFSRSKAAYLLGAARAVLDGSLPLAVLSGLDAAEAERRLLALHGVGPWTARYVMLRGLGLADCAPIGDSGLATALQRFHALPARPDARQTEQLMQVFSPCRSLATLHLWASLTEQA
ncbi:DNA-3-methyladenine glycosylase [Aquitalea sp. LB_tupeE]|uniref:DNA-3-methyladenine glycosylase family protein n=1 Tax=Aquitalea sp. LB_tupeE TaxID=2748078 RepID=UPI0015BD225A|nr:DNA-3-methyladenine glycosylase 2 [Aquitalea sp. LB_tupeE]NWK78936.1 DNA-3-methyladenine glycosylase 2 [Aquitalea sp. LB_tupeE]